jgi:hypothetical protein
MYTITKYSLEFKDSWDKFVAESNNGTMFHTLDFLDYHRNKFEANLNHLIWLKGEHIFAVMPFAVFEENGKRIGKSPFGASFGGIVCKDKLSLSESVSLAQTLVEYTANIGCDEVRITPTPWHYHTSANQYIDFALMKNGFQLTSRDVFNAIKLPSSYQYLWENNYVGRCRTTLRKRTEQFNIIQDAPIEDFYPILLEDKARHNNSQPTHSLRELQQLKDTFPDKVWADIAIGKSTNARAGICYFQPSENCIMTFYMSQETSALKLDGKNVLVDNMLKRAIEKGISYFDFGGSTIGFEIENIGVSKFKESFGAKGYFRDTLILSHE